MQVGLQNRVDTSPQLLPTDVRSADELAKIVGGPSLLAGTFAPSRRPGEDFFVDLRFMVDDINALLRAPGTRLVRPHDIAPMPSFTMPQPAPIDPTTRPFRPQPVSVQPYVISQDPECDLRLGDGSRAGGPVSGRDPMLLVLKKVRDAVHTLNGALDAAAGSNAPALPSAAETGSLGRFIDAMQQSGLPLRAALTIKERFDAGTLDREDLLGALRQAQAQGADPRLLADMKQEAAAVLKAVRAGESTGASGPPALPAESVARMERACDAVAGMNDVLFDIARMQMRVAMASVSDLQV